MTVGLQRGFALVVTLIMLALAAIIVAGLLTSASVDRRTASLFDQKYQAELAAQSGLEAAKKALSYDGSGNTITKDDTYAIVRAAVAVTPPLNASDEDTIPHYYFVAHYQPNSNQVSYYPLFSGGTAQSNVAVTTAPTVSWTGSQAAATDGSGIDFPRLFNTTPHSTWQKSTASNPIHTSWVTVPATPPASQPYYRYAFWTEDLASYIDANVAGNSDNGGAHTRSLGNDPKEVALFTTFNSSLAVDDGSTYAKTLVGNHGLLFTRLTTRLSTTSNSADDKICTSGLVANLNTDSEQLVIPVGMGYKNEGQPKTNLNQIIKNSPNDAGVAQIAKAISDNLPNFAGNRQGGLASSSQDYNKTIAAGIIGYAQPASAAPLVASTYRGLGLYPLVSEFYDRVEWTSSDDTAKTISVTFSSYVELWNMTGQQITGWAKFTPYYRHPMTVGTNAYFGDNDDPANPPSGSKVTGMPYQPAQVTMQPNEYQVINFGTATYTFSCGSVAPSSIASLQMKADRKSSYKLDWSSDGTTYVTVDTPLVAQQSAGQLGVQKDDNTLYNPATKQAGQSSFNWSGSVPGLVYYNNPGSYIYNLGDPRAAYYLSSTQASSDYNKDATMWSKNGKPSSSKTIAQEVKVSSWPDGGHNTLLINPAGLSDTSYPPTSRPSNAPAIDPGKAPARTSNIGKLLSITELSYIYDPAQWNITPDSNNRWVDITSSTLPDSKYGGGLTLRIGRPEFSRFDTDDSRASRLLDIFSAADASNTPNQYSTRGKININTATRESLRALGAGIRLGHLNSGDVDTVVNPDPLYGPTASIAADRFADAVINMRSSQPFISTSQLAQLKAKDKNGQNSAFFGNPDQWTNNDGPKVESDGSVDWNDAASEQYFAKIYNFTTTRSRNFRVFVTGQYIDPTTNDPVTGKPPRVIATANKVYQVFLKPTRNSSGAITDQACVVTYSADVP